MKIFFKWKCQNTRTFFFCTFYSSSSHVFQHIQALWCLEATLVKSAIDCFVKDIHTIGLLVWMSVSKTFLCRALPVLILLLLEYRSRWWSRWCVRTCPVLWLSPGISFIILSKPSGYGTYWCAWRIWTSCARVQVSLHTYYSFTDPSKMQNW